MQARIVTDSTADFTHSWEAFVKSNTDSGFMQSLPWANFKTKRGLQATHVVLEKEDGTIYGGAIFYHARNHKNASILVAPDGPILPWHDEPGSERGLQLIRQCIDAYARRHNIIAIRIEPRLVKQTPLLSDFGKAPLDLNPRETLVVDLNKEPEEMLMSFKNKCRYNIRLSQRKEISICEKTNKESLPAFYSVMKEASRRDGFIVEPQDFFADLIESLAPAGMVKLLFAEHEGDLLGALMLIQYGSRATYLYGGISNRKRNLMAGYALQWQAMLAARQSGCTSYDFYGLDQFETPGHPYARFSRFKKGFGGRVVRNIGAQDHFFLEPLTNAVMNAILEIDWSAQAPALV